MRCGQVFASSLCGSDVAPRPAGAKATLCVAREYLFPRQVPDEQLAGGEGLREPGESPDAVTAREGASDGAVAAGNEHEPSWVVLQRFESRVFAENVSATL